MPTEAAKRDLSFTTIDEMVRDIDILLSRGYDKKGDWNLAQACCHVSDWMRFPMDGFPRPPLPMRWLLWVMKHTVAPGMRRKILNEGFKTGMMTDPTTVPAPDFMTDEEAARLLRETALRLANFEGALHESPLFGAMDRELALKAGLLHAAHHLALLHPK